MKTFWRFVTGLIVVGATVGAGLGAVVLGAAPAGAATTLITVNDAGDGVPVPANCLLATEGDCTLRAAVEAAVGGDTTIALPDANSVPNNPSLTHTYTLLNANGSLVLNDSVHTVTINGAGQSLAIIDLVGASTLSPNRVLQVGIGTTAVISGITAEGGVIAGGGPGGGGILNDGTLNLSSSTVTGNSSSNSGGGVYLDGVASTLTGDTITANSAGSGGGVTMEDGANVISGGSVDGNDTTSSEGGGVDIEDLNPGDSATLSNVDVSSNTASDDGGGLYVGNQSATSNNLVTLTNVTADNNTADGAGGGLYVSNDGAGGGTVTMTGGSASGNSCGEDGGGIFDQNDGSGSVSFTGVSVNSNTVSDNGSGTGAGGGIYVQDDGSGDSTTFSGGSIDDNSTPTNATNGQGGGVYLLNNGSPSSASFSGGTISGNSAYEGGGVYLPPGSFPTRTGDLATFTNETVSGNNVTEAGGGFTDNAGTVQPLTIASSTISGNSAGTLGTSDGGGIEAFAPSTCDLITLTNDTITGNTAVNGGGYYGAGCTSPTVATAFQFDTISGNTATNNAGAGNIQTIDGSALTLADSIVANGSASGGAATNCLLTGGGSLTSGGYNLIDNTNCGTPAATDIIGTNPLLGPLGNNGGPTQTEEPAPASPAVGAIPSATCSGTGVSTDQRGDARGAGIHGSCTIGSVEVAAASPGIGTTASPASEVVGSGPLHDSATLSGGDNPTGTITWYLFGPTQTCTATPTLASQYTFTTSRSVSGNATYSTPSGYTPTTTGTWNWVAVYSGDGNNNGVNSVCGGEPVTVNPASLGIGTTASPASEVVGSGPLNDSATLSGGDNPTGTITWYLFGPTQTCTATPTLASQYTFTTSRSVSGNATYSTPSGYTPTMTGTWNWVAVYSGDGNNNGVDSVCGGEPVTVNPASLGIGTTASPASEVVGSGPLNDSATLSGGDNPTGTITWYLFGPTQTCTATPTLASQYTFTTSRSVSGNATYSTPSGYTPTMTGTWNWVAVYSGDGNNNGVNSICSHEQVTVNPASPPPPPPPPPPSGYRFAAADGGIFDYGDATFRGSAGSLHLNAPVVGMAVTPSTHGYWIVASDGGIFNYGDAKFFGSMAGRHLNAPIVGMAATGDGGGYWLVAADGGIFTFGDARFFGSAGGLHLNEPIVGMAADPSGGYWLVASDGGIFSYGGAVFHGSAGSLHLNKPVVGMAAGPGGKGYWLVAADGGIFGYGSTGFFGSAGSLHLNKPVVGMAAGPGGKGYWLVASDGGIFSYGDATFFGSMGGRHLNVPVVGMTAA